MPLGSAHRLAPEATFLDPDPAADAATVGRALDLLAAFSPGVAGATDPSDPAFGLLEVQIDGLDRLWGPEPVLIGRIATALRPVLPGPPRAGIAGTRFAATVAASLATRDPATRDPAARGRETRDKVAHDRVARDVAARGSAMRDVAVRNRIVGPGEDAAFLASLPAALLTPDPDIRARLARFGLRRIGAVAGLPRSALVARFGDEGERLHARANGEEIVTFRPRRRPEQIVLGLGLEPPVEALDSLRFVLHRLAGALADQLTARGAATGRVELRLTLETTFSPRGTPARLTVGQGLPEPTAEGEAIERLLFARLERDPPPAAVSRIELELTEVGPASGQQLSLFVPQAARAARLGWQLARLGLTFGEDRIGRLELVDPEALLPEARWSFRPIGSGSGDNVRPVVPVVPAAVGRAVR